MKDSSIPEVNIEDFAPKLVQKSGAKRTAFSGTFEPTFRCNNRCVHCYVNKPQNDDQEKGRELTYPEICRIFDEIAEQGCLRLLLTGGDPLVREDFEDIYRYAKKKGFLITLFTNGTLITPSLADFLKEFPPRLIEISLYGATERTHERVTGSPGSYGKCLEGIELLVQRNLPLNLKTVAMTLNRHEFMRIKRFVENLGLDFRFDALINQRIDGCRDLTELRIAPREVMDLDLTDPKRRSGFVECYEKTSLMGRNREFRFQCGAGLNSFHVDPYGQLMVCGMVRFPSYDLRKGSFERGWHDFLSGVRGAKSKKENSCKDCGLISICDQCPGWSQLEHRDPDVPVDFLCQVAHLRAEAYGIGQ